MKQIVELPMRNGMWYNVCMVTALIESCRCVVDVQYRAKSQPLFVTNGDGFVTVRCSQCGQFADGANLRMALVEWDSKNGG